MINGSVSSNGGTDLFIFARLCSFCLVLLFGIEKV